MADQKTTDAAISSAVKTYYDKLLIKRLEPKTFLHQFAEKRPIPMNGGKTIEFTGYRNIKPIVSNSGELSSTQTYISAYTISTTLVQRHNYVQFSTLLKETAIDPNVKGAVDVLADQMAKTVEVYLRQSVVAYVGFDKRSGYTGVSFNTAAGNYSTQGVLTGNSSQRNHVVWSEFPRLHNKTRLGTTAAKIGTIAGSAASLNQVRHAVNYLRSKDVEPIDGTQDYIFYCHTWVADALMQDPKWSTWNKYSNADKMFRGEVGKVFGARIVQSNIAFRYVFSAAPLTTASGALNASFIFGKGAFGSVELGSGKQGGYEIIVKNPGPNNTNDPANLISTVAGKSVMAGVVLNKSAGALVINTDRVASSGT